MSTPARDAEFSAVAADRWTNRRVVSVAALLCASALLLHAPRLLYPMLSQDDFAHLREAWTWQTTQENLWRPFNEHAMPLGRIATWLLVRLSGRAVVLPYAAAAQGPLAVLLIMLLLFQFVRRELGHPVYGLAAMGLFGVSTQYFQAVAWYAATFALLGLATTLLALLAAQSWRRTGHARHRFACASWSCLALGWFGGGILAGPLCALYLLVSPPRGEASLRRRVSGALAPLAGTALFLVVSLPRTADAIMHTGHYGGKTALEAFHLGTALVYSGRSLVDNLLLGTFGVTGLLTPVMLVPVVLLGMLAAGLWWFRLATDRHLLLVGVGAILASYLLIYGARSEWDYEQLATWSRYQVYAYFGLVLFVCGGLPHWQYWFVSSSRSWAPPGTRFWLTALALVLLTQVWRGLPFRHDLKQIWAANPSTLAQVWCGLRFGHDPAQLAQLRVVDGVDARCRQHHISAADARAALAPWQMVGGGKEDNAWDLLRGSDSAQPMDPAEVRQLLQPSLSNGDHQ